MNEITLTPKLRLGKLFRQGEIEDNGNVQLAIVATANFPMSNYDWKMTTKGDIFIGSSDAINKPMNSKSAKFIAPFDAFKLKVQMLGGYINITLNINGQKITLKLTTAKVLANKDNIESLAVTKKFGVIEDDIPETPIPDKPNPDEEKPEEKKPVKEKAMKFYQKWIKPTHKFLHKNRKYAIPAFLFIIIVIGWNVFGIKFIPKWISTAVNTVTGILTGTYLSK
ncbi:hypothetical protein KAR91_79740 [Candidatus Pacearchaeota archaeon]|nr:hypothetical protein [Candidatus Pacearchaeota archaeon]